MDRKHPVPRPVRRAALLAALTALVAAGTLAARPMTSEDLVRLKEVESAVVSPDGSRIAYRLEVPRVPFRDEDGPAWSELWLVAPGSEARPYVGGEVDVSDVTWTPDGSAVSFLAKRGEDEHDALWVIPADGGEARRILGHETGIEGYAWSPDGRRVAFRAEEPEPPEEKERTEALEAAGFTQNVYEEDWRFTRLWIAQIGDDLRADPPGDGVEEPGPRRLDLPGHVREVHWCPGGDRLAVTLAPDPSVDASYVATRLRVVDPATGAVTAGIENPGKLGEIAWSPDCSALAYVAAADAHDPAPGRLMLASAADGTFRDLVPGYEGHVRDVAWADGDTLVFLGDEGVSTLVYRLDLPANGAAAAPAVVVASGETQWDDLSLSDDGSRFALVGDSPRHPEEVFFGELSAAGASPRRLTDSNPWLAEIDLAPQEVVEYEARDGLRLQGILIRPLSGSGTGGEGAGGDGEGDGGRHPLIEKVHGGPESHYRNGWLTAYSLPGQVAAGKGYAVFYPNYRGSTGRGVEFSKLSQGRPAKEEFDDLVDGVRHLVETGLADPERVGITGGSYGGYASAWGATYHSEHYAAAVMAVGVSNKISKLLTSDIPEELHLVHERQRPWDDWRHFLEASPIYHAERAETPILILHGEEDTRVYPGQSLELYRALEILDRAPVRLVTYPGEGHGNRRAASRYDFNLRMLRWFDHYLKGPGGDPPPWRVDYPLREEHGEEAESGEPEETNGRSGE